MTIIIYFFFPLKIKHHLSQLEAKGFVSIDSRNGKIARINHKSNTGDFLISIPIPLGGLG